MKSRESQLGFTLAEMIVVISIIGIALAFTIPNFAQGRRQAEVQAVQRELSSDFRSAQTNSMSQHISPTDGTVVETMGVYVTRSAYTLFYGDGVNPYVANTPGFTVVKTKDFSPLYFTNIPDNGSLTFYFRRTREGAEDAGTLKCVDITQCQDANPLTFTVASNRIPGYQKSVIIHPSGLIEVAP